MKAILINREGFTKELTVKRDDFRQVIAVAKYPHVGIYEKDYEVDVSRPDEHVILFYYERQFIDEHNRIVLIYKEK